MNRGRYHFRGVSSRATTYRCRFRAQLSGALPGCGHAPFHWTTRPERSVSCKKSTASHGQHLHTPSHSTVENRPVRWTVTWWEHNAEKACSQTCTNTCTRNDAPNAQIAPTSEHMVSSGERSIGRRDSQTLAPPFHEGNLPICAQTQLSQRLTRAPLPERRLYQIATHGASPRFDVHKTCTNPYALDACPVPRPRDPR